MLADLRHALRLLVRRIDFTLLVVVVLGVGIGASVTTFSLFDTIHTQALPYPESDRLAANFEDSPEQGLQGILPSYKNFEYWREQSRTIETFAIGSRVVNVAAVLPGEADSETVPASLVSPEYFDLIGARATSGRLFGREDDVAPMSHPVVIVSEEMWRDRLGARVDVLGESLLVNGSPYTVIGIVEANVVPLQDRFLHVDLGLPILQGHELLFPDLTEVRAIRMLPVFGRFADGHDSEKRSR